MPASTLEPLGNLPASRIGGQPHELRRPLPAEPAETRTPLPFNPESLHPEPEPAFYIETRRRVDRRLGDRALPECHGRAIWNALPAAAIAAREYVLVNA
jgi:hypothetical protein